MAAADRLRHQGHGLGVDGVVGEVDEAQPDLLGQRRHQLALGQHAEVDEDAAQAAAQAALLLDGDLELLRRQQPALEQDVAELLHVVPIGSTGAELTRRVRRARRAWPRAARAARS